mmetsp:Transcript_4195/g.7115  ORF Transcript_4195/g.7115 Transcript_4195/m.7115 type:complete len:184 (+) Transcript_4195:430-981(+)
MTPQQPVSYSQPLMPPNVQMGNPQTFMQPPLPKQMAQPFQQPYFDATTPNQSLPHQKVQMEGTNSILEGYQRAMMQAGGQHPQGFQNQFQNQQNQFIQNNQFIHSLNQNQQFHAQPLPFAPGPYPNQATNFRDQRRPRGAFQGRGGGRGFQRGGRFQQNQGRQQHQHGDNWRGKQEQRPPYQG